MLAKKFRLPIQSFHRLRARSANGHYFSYKNVPNNLPYSRFGAILSRRTEKRAVRRNKMRRIIFDHVRSGNLHHNPGYDFLIIARPEAFTARKQEIEAELNRFLNPNS